MIKHQNTVLHIRSKSFLYIFLEQKSRFNIFWHPQISILYFLACNATPVHPAKGYVSPTACKLLYTVSPKVEVCKVSLHWLYNII